MEVVVERREIERVKDEEREGAGNSKEGREQ